jgi:hypothetical protein
MDERALFTTLWENESKTTRKVIARIPEGSTYRPDPKSRTASEIAWQIACEEKMIIEAVETGKAEWKPPAAPATIKEMLDNYDKQSADIVRRWKSLPVARWNGTLEFFGGQRPASPMAWSFSSTSCTIEARSRPTSARWDRRFRRSTDRAGTSLRN